MLAFLILAAFVGVLFLIMRKYLKPSSPEEEKYTFENLDKRFSASEPAVEIKNTVWRILRKSEANVSPIFYLKEPPFHVFNQYHSSFSPPMDRFCRRAEVSISPSGISITLIYMETKNKQGESPYVKPLYFASEGEQVKFSFFDFGFAELPMPTLCLYTEWLAKTIAKARTSWSVILDRIVIYPATKHSIHSSYSEKERILDRQRIDGFMASRDEVFYSSGPSGPIKNYDDKYYRWEFEPVTSVQEYILTVDFGKMPPPSEAPVLK